MDMQGKSADYLSKLGTALAQMNCDEMDHAMAMIKTAWLSGKQVITLGNGGSSMTALHFITDWNKSVFLKSGIPFRGRTLVDNMGLVMAYANDTSFADIFVEQLKNILQPGDLVIAISGSGNSENVIRAVEYANQNGAVTLGLCGFTGGKLKNMVQHAVWANVQDMQITEDIHAIFGHIVMKTLCEYKADTTGNTPVSLHLVERKSA